MSIASTSVETAMQAIQPSYERLARSRIRDNHLEFAAVNETNAILCEAHIPLDGDQTDSKEFVVDRRSLAHLGAGGDSSMQIRWDEEMIAVRAGEHVYSSLSEAEDGELDLCPVPYPDPAARMETTPAQLWELMRVRSSCVAFSGEDGAMWLSGKKGPGSLSGGVVRVPSESATVPIECVSIIDKKLLRRVLRQIPEGSELTVVVGHDVPVVLEWGDEIDCRQAIAPRIQDDHSSWEVKAEVSH